MDDHLGKPFKVGQLKEMLQNWLPAVPISTNYQSSTKNPDNDAMQSNTVNKPVDTEAALNSSQVKMNQENLGDQYPEIVTLTIGSMQQCVSVLNKAINEKDTKEIEREAHRLKGAMGTAGALRMLTLSKQLEQAAKDNDMRTAEQLFLTFPEAISELTTALTNSIE